MGDVTETKFMQGPDSCYQDFSAKWKLLSFEQRSNVIDRQYVLKQPLYSVLRTQQE